MKKMILLYYPGVRYEPEYKFFWTPLSLISISKLIQDDYKILIIDGNTQKEFQGIIQNNIDQCFCIGISTMTGGGQLRNALDFSNYVKNVNKQIPVVWGGTHPTSLPSETIKNEGIDIIVRGQGEVTFKELVDSLITRKSLKNIYGISYKKENRIIHNFDRPVCNINKLPDMPWDLVNVKKYLRNDLTINTRTINFVSSYGCPYNCKFCYEVFAYKRKWTGLVAQRLLEEIKKLIDKYGINGIKFYDANFFVQPSRIIDFCTGIMERKLKIKWAASAHPKDILRLKNHLRYIKESGCSRILIGAESGSPEVLKFIDKGATVEEILNVAKLCEEHEIVGSFTFIVGFPIDADRNGYETKCLIEKIQKKYPKHEIRVHLWAPYPGTKLYPIALENGFIPPRNLNEWSNYEYYKPQTPWINEELIKMLEYTRQWNLKGEAM